MSDSLAVLLCKSQTHPYSKGAVAVNEVRYPRTTNRCAGLIVLVCIIGCRRAKVPLTVLLCAGL